MLHWNMALKEIIFLMLIYIETSQTLPAGCRDGFIKRTMQDNDQVTTLCCHPTGYLECSPNHEVRFCQENRGMETCEPCPAGFVQPRPSDSFSRELCVKDSLECAEEAVLVVVGGRNACKCDVSRNYCGDPSNCQEESCEEGFILHPDTCRCVVPSRPGPTTGVMPTTESVETPPTSPAENGTQGVQDPSDATLVPPSTASAGQPAAGGPGDGSRNSTDPATSHTDGDGYRLKLGLGLGLGLVCVALAATLIILHLREEKRLGRETSYGNPRQIIQNFIVNITSVKNKVIVNRGSHQDPHQGEENRDGGAESNEMTDVKLTDPIQENGAAEQEEGGPGDAPDKPFLPPQSYYHSLH